MFGMPKASAKGGGGGGGGPRRVRRDGGGFNATTSLENLRPKDDGGGEPRRNMKQRQSQGKAMRGANGLPPGARLGKGRGGPARSRPVHRSRSDNFSFPIST